LLKAHCRDGEVVLLSETTFSKSRISMFCKDGSPSDGSTFSTSVCETGLLSFDQDYNVVRDDSPSGKHDISVKFHPCTLLIMRKTRMLR